MAIKLSDFKKATYKAGGKTIEVPNLYQSIKRDTKNGYKFLARFVVDGKIISKVLGYSEKDKLTPRSANEKLIEYKNEVEAGYTSSNKINLDALFEEYFKELDTSKQWTDKKRYIYEHYIKSYLGKKNIEAIRPTDINRLLADMKKRELSPRTQKSVLEILKPLYNFANENKFTKENPVKNINVKIPNQKKIVTSATELFTGVHGAINSLFADNPYYRALFMFGFSGRRKNEVLTLKWESIDFENNYYWLEGSNVKNASNQKYPLYPFIKEALLQIPDTKRGLVFKSPITGKKISNIDRQMRNIKKHIAFMFCDDVLYQAYTVLKAKEKTEDYINSLKWSDAHLEDIKEILSSYKGNKTGLVFAELQKDKTDALSFHYMRNILVSMLAEQHTEAIVLSGILGHSDVNTINRYLSINHYKSGTEGLKTINQVLDVEVIG